jgi:hypothetical protein
VTGKPEVIERAWFVALPDILVAALILNTWPNTETVLGLFGDQADEDSHGALRRLVGNASPGTVQVLIHPIPYVRLAR